MQTIYITYHTDALKSGDFNIEKLSSNVIHKITLYSRYNRISLNYLEKEVFNTTAPAREHALSLPVQFMVNDLVKCSPVTEIFQSYWNIRFCCNTPQN